MLFKKEEPPLKLCEHQKNSGILLDETGKAINGQEIEACSICAAEEKRMTRYRWKLMAGLALPFIIQAFDTTIIAGAITTIASDFSNHPLSDNHFEPG